MRKKNNIFTYLRISINDNDPDSNNVKDRNSKQATILMMTFFFDNLFFFRTV